MIGRTLGHYHILEKTGTGGMGEVYRARDTHLDRDVAVKVLPPGLLADEPSRKRFRKEADALSKLNHPHIAVVHDFASQDGADYLVMEFVSGEPLAEKLKAGPLSEKQAIELGEQIASALEEAHEQGVIHRDLKPSNVMVTAKGQAKVLDFGLARLMRPLTDDAPTVSLTQTHNTAGTLPYMAPEQLRGEPADARTDIHALGSVLYEMATGRRPFHAKLPTALAADIQAKIPEPPRSLNARLSSELERIILKCLEKDPANRFQSAKELVVDLRRLGMPSSAVAQPAPPVRAPSRRRMLAVAGTAGAVLIGLLGFGIGGLRERLFAPATPQIESIAVLPLENLSRDPDQDYLVDGMHEALITEMSKISALKVISRTSAMQYKGVKKPLPQIARELGVDGVIEGSVAREGDEVRITVQLIHGATDKHLWADNYQRTLRGILALQSEVARAIANEIKIKLTPEEQTRLANAGAVNPAAHEAYLKGRYYWNKFSQEGINKSIEYFQQAIQQDPRYALAYAGLADSYSFLGAIGELAAPKEAMPRADTAARKALEIDETLVEAHVALALVRLSYDWDWTAAQQEFQRALQLNPSHAGAYHWYSHYLLALGRVEESLAASKRARELDPLNLGITIHMGCHYLYARQFDEAVEACQKTVEMDPNFWWARYYLGVALEQRGDLARAIAELNRAREIEDTSRTLAALGHAYAASSKRDEALKTLAALQELSKRKYVSPYDTALIYAGLGDKDRAFAWLEKAYQDRSGWLPYLKVDARLDSLRSDPRFQNLLRRMNFLQ